MFKKKFSETMFESEVIVIVDSKENLKELLKWTDFDGFYNWEWTIYIADNSDLLKTLSHEVMHFVHHHLKDWCNISLTWQTEETYAYFYSYYLEKIWKRMNTLQINNEKK